MVRLPRGWRVYTRGKLDRTHRPASSAPRKSGRTSYQKAWNPRRRHKQPGARRKRRTALRLHHVMYAGFAALFVGTFWTGLPNDPSMSFTMKLRHMAAAPNCSAARAVGLAPAHRGEPGYYLTHDRDRDGIACEPWPRR